MFFFSFQDQHGWFCLVHLWSISSGVGTTFPEHFWCTTRTLCPPQKATSTLWSAMSLSLQKLQLTMTCITSRGTCRPGSILTPSPSTTPERWLPAVPPLPGSSGETTRCWTKLIRSYWGLIIEVVSPLVGGALGSLNAQKLETHWRSSQGLELAGFAAL